MSTTQYFIPQMSWLSGIDIVADFDENAVGNETLEFAIYDEKGKKIYDDQGSILIYLIILEIIQKIFRKPSADNEEKEKNHDL